MRALLAVPAVAALGVVAACGGGSSTTSSTVSTAESDLSALLLRDGELPGYKRDHQPDTTTDAGKWASLNRGAVDTKRLKSLGFVAGARVDLKNTAGGDGLSLVERFATSASAARELADLIAGETNPDRFAVPGIPGAIGFEVGPPSARGRNIGFTKGQTYYVVGYFITKDAPPRSSLIATAQRQYQAG